jgi:protein-disulfide isomerase
MPKEQGMSKREQLREKRAREAQRSRLMIIAGIVVLAVLVVAFVVIQSNPTPAGEIAAVTPRAYPQADMNTMGDPNAPVKVDVWEDLQCPACQRYSENVEPLLIENYVKTGKVYYTFHHFPFLDNYSSTNESDQAASASLCAGDQGQFWQYKEVVFANWNGENQGAYNDQNLTAFAEALGLNMDNFTACFQSNKYKAEVDQSYNDGVAQGIASTPTTFVNGVQVTNPDGPNLVPTYENIADMIDAALSQ